MGDTWVIPIGPSMATNSLVLAQHVFTEVVTGASLDAGASQVDAILTPKVAFISRTVGATSFGKSITAIKVEWTLAEPSGQTIWADTISGEQRLHRVVESRKGSEASPGRPSCEVPAGNVVVRGYSPIH